MSGLTLFINKRVIKSLNGGIAVSSQKITQNDYVKFLTEQVKDNNFNHLGTVLEKLDQSHQKDFFSEVIKEGKLIEVLNKLPCNMKNLYLYLGDFLKFSKFNEANELLANVLSKIEKFKNLESLDVDLSGIARLTPSVIGDIQNNLSILNHDHPKVRLNRTKDGSARKFGSYRTVENNLRGPALAIEGLIKHLKETKSLQQMKIRFGEDCSVTISEGDFSNYLKIKEFGKESGDKFLYISEVQSEYGLEKSNNPTLDVRLKNITDKQFANFLNYGETALGWEDMESNHYLDKGKRFVVIEK